MRPQAGSHLSSRELARRRSDREIARRAEGRHGVVTLAELEDLGLSGRAVRHRIAAGRLHRLHRGVYAVAPPAIEGRWLAAVLAAGTGAVLSHHAAAALWGLCRETYEAVDVTVRGRTTRTRPGIRIHSGGALAQVDLARRGGIPCTALPRTLLDLATVVDRRSLARAVDRAEELRAFDRRAVDHVLARNPGARGTGALAAVLADYAAPTITRSEAEERFLGLVRQAALPTPRVNAWLALPEGGGYRPDFLWQDARLIVEVDGRAHHARRRAFEHDRRRDRRLALAGFETRRYAAAELVREPKRVVAELRAFLAEPPSR